MTVKKTILSRCNAWITDYFPKGGTSSAARLGIALLAIALPASLLSSLLAMAASTHAYGLPTFNPAPNTHTAPITTSILVTFNAAIDPSTVSTRTIAIHGAQHGLVTGTYLISRTQVLMTPARPFYPGELVLGVVTTATQAITGPVLATPAAWHFRTATGASPGAFFRRTSGLDSSWSEDISLGDLDGDGDIDIFLGNRDPAGTVWFNDGSGNFTSSGVDLGTDFLIDVSLGDMDMDGDLDAVAVGIQDNKLWRNNGDGSFSSSAIFAGSAIIRRVAVGDLDGDADLDAVTVTACDPFDPDQACAYALHRIWWNDGAGGFQPAVQALGNGTSADAALGDLDGDGDLDAMVVSGRTQASAVWVNLGSGVFTRAQTFDSPAAASVQFGDLDNDGDLDAFVASQAGAFSMVWINDGNGAFTPGQSMEGSGPAALGDLDGDSDLDAFSAERVWLNQGDGTFVWSVPNQGMALGTGVALGDLDGDLDLDAVASGYGPEPGLWINQPVYWMWLPWIQN